MSKYSAICCYFGHWPTHFQYWLNSCKYNPEINFGLVTDISVDGFDIPNNVRIIPMTFDECRDLIQAKFPEIEISLDRPYKLCDFKTAYGYIFEDLFQGYDYWGYFDIDTIWGNILDFIPNNEDNHLIKIFPCGHLSFIRNVAPWSKIYELVNRVEGTPCRNNMEGKMVVSWQECFSSPENFYYDEVSGLEPLISHLLKHGDIESKSVYLGVDFDNILPPWRFDHFYSINSPEKSRFLVYGYDTGNLERIYLQGTKIHREPISYLHFSKRSMSVPSGNNLEYIYSIIPSAFVQCIHLNIVKVLFYGRPRCIGNLITRVIKRLF